MQRKTDQVSADINDLEQAMINLSLVICEDASQHKSPMNPAEIERINALTNMYLALKHA